MTAQYQAGFRAYALAHSGVGDPITDEFPSAQFTCQMTTAGMLVYEPISQAIGFLESGADYQLTADGVRLRESPSTSAPIVAENLGLGTVVHVLFVAIINADGHAWRYAHTPQGEGWIAVDFLGSVGTLTLGPDYLFTFEELWSTIQAAGDEFGFDPQIIAGIVQQESGFRNYRVHFDGTGHGLMGLDDGGLLPDFERWSGLSIGRGQDAAMIPVELQLRYAAKWLAGTSKRLGVWNAVRSWHTGEGNYDSAAGVNYEALIRGHISDLFG